MDVTENLPKLAQITDKLTMIRSMVPVGLFNHTAAIYQIHTGYTADSESVRPIGTSYPKDFPNFVVTLSVLNHRKFPCSICDDARPLRESNVVNKSGTAGFLGRAYDRHHLFHRVRP